jgi:hypothetical protein
VLDGVLEREVVVIRRMLQRGFALGFAGMLGLMFIARPANGLPAPQDGESIERAEGLHEQDLTPEEQEAMRAWVASMEASPMGDARCLIEPYLCPYEANCAFMDGTPLCEINQCGEGACSICPGFLSKLLIKAWCSYECKSGGKVVGGAFIFRHRFLANGGNSATFCIDKNGKIYENGKLK